MEASVKQAKLQVVHLENICTQNQEFMLRAVVTYLEKHC